MNLKQYLTPQVIQKFTSKFNKEVELVAFSGSLRLDMGNLTQSGEVIERIWNKAFKDLLPTDFVPDNVLILGFGAGSAAKLVHRKWPRTHITGIELDPMVINIAKTHFKIDQIPNLDIYNTDAHDFVMDLQNTRYDLILLDCYLGDQFPKKLEDHHFLKKLSDLSYHVIINRLFWGEYQKSTLTFKEKLEKDFFVTTTRTPSNFLLHLAQPSSS